MDEFDVIDLTLKMRKLLREKVDCEQRILAINEAYQNYYAEIAKYDAEWAKCLDIQNLADAVTYKQSYE